MSPLWCPKGFSTQLKPSALSGSFRMTETGAGWIARPDAGHWIWKRIRGRLLLFSDAALVLAGDEVADKTFLAVTFFLMVIGYPI